MKTLDQINALPVGGFVTYCQDVLEHCEWVLPLLAAARPFERIDDMQQTLAALLDKASPEKRDQAIKGHPKLAANQAVAGFSQNEQRKAGLLDLSVDEMAHFVALNTQYEQKHGFPFVIAVTGMNKADILGALENRWHNPTEQEWQTAYAEAIKIAQLRVQRLIRDV